MTLIANYDGNASAHLFTTYNGAGNHTGTPSNGNEIQVIQDVGTSNPTGGNNRALIFPVSSGQSPTYASPGSMALPSITFNGSADVMQAYNNTGSTSTSLHIYSPPGGWTIIGAFRLAAAATNNANIWDNTSLYMDNSQTFGLVFKTISGVHYVHAYSYDTNADVTTGMAISLDTDYVFCARLYSGNRIDLRIFSGAGGATTNYQSAGTGTNSGGGAIFVGRNGPGTAYFNGVIGELSFYNTDEAFLDASGNLNTGTALNDMIDKWLPAGGTTYDESLTLARTASLTASGSITSGHSLTLAVSQSLTLAAVTTMQGAVSLESSQSLDSIGGKVTTDSLSLGVALSTTTVGSPLFSDALALAKTASMDVSTLLTREGLLSLGRELAVSLEARGDFGASLTTSLLLGIQAAATATLGAGLSLSCLKGLTISSGLLGGVTTPRLIDVRMQCRVVHVDDEGRTMKVRFERRTEAVDP